MKTIAIICEYNPFHRGHAAQIAVLRDRYPDCRIVCLMSGNFTQRGEPAILPLYDRAEMAIVCGADLVLELPQPWASGSAEYFAAGGVQIANRLGVIDMLAFGCETADMDLILHTAERLDSPAFAHALAADSAPGEGSAARIARVWRTLYGDDGGLLSQPNNLLAVQYCLALRRQNSSIRPLAMLRIGSGYRETALTGELPSATAVRQAILSGTAPEELAAYLPPAAVSIIRRSMDAGRAPVAPAALAQAVLSYYRMADPDALAACASMRGGLNFRLCCAAHEAESWEAFQSLAATKVYTNSRIRRAVLHGMLGVKEADLTAAPSCTLLLAANANGRAILAEIRRKEGIPVVTKPADLCRFASPRELMLRRRADALYTLAMPKGRESGTFVRCTPYFAE